MADKYFEELKRKNLVFTMHNIDSRLPYLSMAKGTSKPVPVTVSGPSYWSRLSRRYRSAEEQREFIKSGCIDKKLPEIK